MGPSFDDTVLALEALAGQRVSVDIYHAYGPRFAALTGMVRRCERSYIERNLESDPDEVAAFYVDGGQEHSSLPAIVLSRQEFIGLAPDEPGAGVGWAVGQTITAVTVEKVD